jgi:hypothetical protein
VGGLKLEARQRSVLARLGPALPASYYLAGGVAVAIHLAHRVSKDLDFFGASDPTVLLSTLEELPGVAVSNPAAGTVHLAMDGVPVSLLDLACMKLSAIASRGAARDFWDLHSIVQMTGKPLGEYLAAFQSKFALVDIGHVVRSLVYFGDADTEPPPSGPTREHWSTIKRDLEAWVLGIEA